MDLLGHHCRARPQGTSGCGSIQIMRACADDIGGNAAAVLILRREKELCGLIRIVELGPRAKNARGASLVSTSKCLETVRGAALRTAESWRRDEHYN
jgi:hypothetical protein